jgi:chromosomal replication initiator protein
MQNNDSKLFYAIAETAGRDLRAAMGLSLLSRTEDIEHPIVKIIKGSVCGFFGKREDEVICRRRKRELVWARQIIAHFMRKYTKLSYNAIGEAMGNIDHTTVIVSCRVVKDLTDTDPALRQQLEVLDNLIAALIANYQTSVAEEIILRNQKGNVFSLDTNNNQPNGNSEEAKKAV